MAITHSSENPAESDSAWKAYRRWVNSKISRLKNYGYKVSEKNFCSGFIPLMEIWKLRNSQLCLPALEVKEVTQEVEEVVVQEAEVVSRYQDCIVEEVAAQIIVSKTQ